MDEKYDGKVEIAESEKERLSKNIKTVKKAAAAIVNGVKCKTGSLLILTGAGMSVKSGVPIFRSNKQISPVFVKFLENYNIARKKHGLEEASSWFQFSVPEMFKTETRKEAWDYWRWRVETAYAASPADDYDTLMKIVKLFGQERCFVVTSNCDSMHARAGMDDKRILEIHGALSNVQCAKPCSSKTWPVEIIRKTLDKKEVPMCTECKDECLRPQVMIFGDGSLVHGRLDEQNDNFERFLASHSKGDMVVLEIGAGTVVPSIRNLGGSFMKEATLIRINPGKEECTDVDDPMMKILGMKTEAPESYCPIQAKSDEALSALGKELGL